MGELSDAFEQGILATGMQRLEHPIFYHAPVGIRFEIGGEEPIYLSTAINKLNVNPAYATAAFNRASVVYSALPDAPSILRIDGYPGERCVKEMIAYVCACTGLPAPFEQVLEIRTADENEDACLQMYWDLSKFVFCRDKLLQEIIKADLGGCSELTSSVYFLDSHNAVLYHLYDDRGLDVIAADRERLRPLYERFYHWILDYDREAINKLFTIQPKQVTK